MGNGEIFSDNLIGNGTISVSTEATGFEKKYLTDNNQGDVWRSTVITETTITIDMGAATEINGIVGLNTNMVIGDTLYKFEASTDNFSSTSETEDVVFDGTNIIAKFNWTYRYYRFRLTKASGTFIQMGMIYLSSSDYIFVKCQKWDYLSDPIKNWNTKLTTGGQNIRTLKFKKRVLDLEFSGIDDAQEEIFETISENAYVVFFPDGITGPLYFGIIDFLNYRHNYDDIWSVNVLFEESPA